MNIFTIIKSWFSKEKLNSKYIQEIRHVMCKKCNLDIFNSMDTLCPKCGKKLKKVYK